MKTNKNTFFILFLAVALFAAAGNIYSQKKTVSKNGDYSAITGLIERTAPGKSGSFVFETIQPENGQEVFELESAGDKIVLRGSNNLALARAFNWYLNYYCHTSVSWFKVEPIDIPATLPAVDKKVRQACRFEKRFFLNYCTFGYTTLWWQWAEWERFIDWMALNGINMPLAITGQEYIWQKVWKKYGMSDEQIRAYFTGPAHLPWHRMGNLDGWMGPLPQSFIDGQFELQKQILKQERSFGMTPVLPAFAGHVPKAIKDKHPDVKITSLGSYTTGDEYNAYFLDPMEPLFVQIQKDFLKEQTKQFGTDHFYGTDPFNEMDPPSWEPEYLANTAKTIYKGMSAIDDDAVWVQMGWTFYYDRKHWSNPRLEAMIKAVPLGKMVILDYFCELEELWKLTDGFFKAPYIWCYLGNFGGGTQMAAPIKKTAAALSKTEKDENRRNMWGIGSTLEGFGVNRFMFEWLFEYAWNSEAADPNKWIRGYARSRTGGTDVIAEEAWSRLTDVVYDKLVSGVGLGNVIEMRPRLEGRPNYSVIGKYDYKELQDIFGQMLLADKSSLANPRYKYDLVMVCRQVLANLALQVRDKCLEAYKAKDIKKFESYSALFLDIAGDMDRCVSTLPEFSLKKWIDDARAFGNDNESKFYYEKNAKVLITTWGQKGNGLIDYAARDYSGLINSFYKKRWEIFFDTVHKTLTDSTVFDQKKFDNDIAEFEWNWCVTEYKQNESPKENAELVVKELYKKYAKYFYTLY
jgi:alpha-N-acetylglucosaminidase